MSKINNPFSSQQNGLTSAMEPSGTLTKAHRIINSTSTDDEALPPTVSQLGKNNGLRILAPPKPTTPLAPPKSTAPRNLNRRRSSGTLKKPNFTSKLANYPMSSTTTRPQVRPLSVPNKSIPFLPQLTKPTKSESEQAFNSKLDSLDSAIDPPPALPNTANSIQQNKHTPNNLPRQNSAPLAYTSFPMPHSTNLATPKKTSPSATDVLLTSAPSTSPITLNKAFPSLKDVPNASTTSPSTPKKKSSSVTDVALPNAPTTSPITPKKTSPSTKDVPLTNAPSISLATPKRVFPSLKDLRLPSASQTTPKTTPPSVTDVPQPNAPTTSPTTPKKRTPSVNDVHLSSAPSTSPAIPKIAFPSVNNVPLPNAPTSVATPKRTSSSIKDVPQLNATSTSPAIPKKAFPSVNNVPLPNTPTSPTTPKKATPSLNDVPLPNATITTQPIKTFVLRKVNSPDTFSDDAFRRLASSPHEQFPTRKRSSLSKKGDTSQILSNLAQNDSDHSRFSGNNLLSPKGSIKSKSECALNTLDPAEQTLDPRRYVSQSDLLAPETNNRRDSAWTAEVLSIEIQVDYVMDPEELWGHCRKELLDDEQNIQNYVLPPTRQPVNDQNQNEKNEPIPELDVLIPMVTDSPGDEDDDDGSQHSMDNGVPPEKAEPTKDPRQSSDSIERNLSPRELWAARGQYVLSTVGNAVDLSNVWRFPFLCYKNGGGAFLIPYFVTLVFGAMPVFLMEMCLGQFHKCGPTAIWDKMSPMFKGNIQFIDFVIQVVKDVLLTNAELARSAITRFGKF